MSYVYIYKYTCIHIYIYVYIWYYQPESDFPTVCGFNFLQRSQSDYIPLSRFIRKCCIKPQNCHQEMKKDEKGVKTIAEIYH